MERYRHAEARLRKYSPSAEHASEAKTLRKPSEWKCPKENAGR